MILHIARIVFILLEVLLLFNLLIVVHELGHYLAARWRGLAIDRFGIWVGKALWKTKIDGVDFCLGSIPAGGHVAHLAMPTIETLQGQKRNGRLNFTPG